MAELDPQREQLNLQLAKTEELPQDVQIRLVAKLLGYRSLPVDIDTFMDDPYYCGNFSGNFYPFWREELRRIFPTCIHTRYPFLVFTGAIGTGKSTMSRFIAMYLMYRITCLVDVYKTLQLVPGKFLKISFFHKTTDLAQSDFISVIDDWIDRSPYFKEVKAAGKLDVFNLVGDTIRSNANIGSDVIFYNLSELNFVPADRAKAKINDATKRLSSRFERFLNYFGFMIIDSSSQCDDSIVDEFVANNPFGDKVHVIYTNRWLVRKHLNYYGRKGYFKCFTGDSTHEPFIIDERAGRIVTSDMDPDRVIDVPEELRADFEFDLITSLQDIAGISVNATNRFFRDTTGWKNSFDLPSFHPDTVKFDFFDRGDKFIYRFDRSIRSIPRDKIIFIRSDIGVVKDNMGLAIAYFDKWEIYNDKNMKLPHVKVPLAVGINRYEGQETPINHLEEFIFDLNDNFEIGCFTADQFASRQLLQDLTMRGIKNQYLSVDRTDEAAIYTKSLANRGLLHIENNDLLLKEGCELQRVGINKVDHPATGSKDIWDAVCGCVFNLYNNLDLAGQLSIKYKVNQYSEALKERVKLNTDSQFQDMIQNLF